MIGYLWVARMGGRPRSLSGNARRMSLSGRPWWEATYSVSGTQIEDEVASISNGRAFSYGWAPSRRLLPRRGRSDTGT